MGEDVFCWSMRRIGAWIGRRKNELKRILPAHHVEGEVVAEGSFTFDSPVGDVMGPIDFGSEKSFTTDIQQQNAKHVDAESVEASKLESAGSSAASSEASSDVSADKGRLIKVLEDVIRLQDEILRMKKGLGDESSSALEHIGFRLEEIMDRSGATPIDGDRIFDIRRHRPDPVAVVKDGSPIAETTRPGWREGDLVLRRATVRVQVVKPENRS